MIQKIIRFILLMVLAIIFTYLVVGFFVLMNLLAEAIPLTMTGFMVILGLIIIVLFTIANNLD